MRCLNNTIHAIRGMLLPALIGMKNNVPSADRPTPRVKASDGDSLATQVIPDAEDMVSPTPGNLQERPINAESIPAVTTTPPTFGWGQVSEEAVVAGRRVWTIAALEHTSSAAVAARLARVTTRVKHVPCAIDAMHLGRPHVGIAARV